MCAHFYRYLWSILEGVFCICERVIAIDTIYRYGDKGTHLYICILGPALWWRNRIARFISAVIINHVVSTNPLISLLLSRV